ncbi:hypothetical protein [Pseudosulfitobacter pseudonitzschiae]|uniref:hypothetical protein n=1 Tax=Pseudosulfitobacter pseudonitzschiae TaxID=1402135 RepID=UPI001E430A72|nr:hypothetical protein [Pseudosulfitobacter pseudonitzschiae]UFF94628.1 hypothetical protein LOE42_20435 [Pseudosulfitobacter pseudonitzschiae]UFF96893.1 hypothetical protein LOE36_16965 [Pseudosulfitobacter pseudonitzschiae]
MLNDQGNDDMPVIVDDAPMLSTQISGLPAQRAAPPPAPPSVRIIRGSSGRKDQIISVQDPVPQNPPSAAAGTDP